MPLLDTILAIFAPYDCLGCGREGMLACSDCVKGFRSPRSANAVAVYEGIAKDLVLHLKSSGAQSAATIMATTMRPAIVGHPVLVPVPTATSRIRRRGYDQSSLIARALSRQSSLGMLYCLSRLGQTRQRGANRQQRLVQLQSAFLVTKPSSVRGRHLLLIDDVTTTGASLEAAATSLLAAGAARVDALCFAYAEPVASSYPRAVRP